MKLFKVKCFGITSEFGNDAMILIDKNFTATEKALFAKEQNIPVCVYMDTIDNQTVMLDYYYPNTQSKLCLHGTLAAGYVYFKNNPRQNKVNVITKMQQHLLIEIIDNKIYISTDIQELPTINIDNLLLCKLLNINNVDNLILNKPMTICMRKLLIEINSINALYNLQPNLKLIKSFSEQNNINGCYAYFRQNETEIIGRNFNHLNPISEDSATGVAACALTCRYQKDLIIYQGANLNNPCMIQTQYTKNKVYIHGSVLEVSKL